MKNDFFKQKIIHYLNKSTKSPHFSTQRKGWSTVVRGRESALLVCLSIVLHSLWCIGHGELLARGLSQVRLLWLPAGGGRTLTIHQGIHHKICSVHIQQKVPNYIEGKATQIVFGWSFTWVLRMDPNQRRDFWILKSWVELSLPPYLPSCPGRGGVKLTQLFGPMNCSKISSLNSYCLVLCTPPPPPPEKDR